MNNVDPGIDPFKIGIIANQRLGMAIEDEHEKPIPTYDGLHVGKKVLVHGLQGTYVSVVESIEGTAAKIKGLLANVCFEEDRGWINLGFGDFSKLTKIEF